MKVVSPKSDSVLPWCPVMSKWAVKISKQHLLNFSLIKGKETTMQNSFWFLGAEDRFQEIKQTIRFGNSPKSGAFWLQSRGGRPLQKWNTFYFPKGWRAWAWGRAEGLGGVSPGEASEVWACVVSFSQQEAWDKNGMSRWGVDSPDLATPLRS